MFSKNSKWIGCDRNFSSPVVIKRFNIKELQKAILDITGLGYYELFVNGDRVSDEHFKPAVSDYSEREFSKFLYPLPDRTSHTIYYNTYDITKYLHNGDNTLAIMLGNGLYRQVKRIVEGNTKFGDELLLRFDLLLAEKGEARRVYSDGTENVTEGFISENNLFFGEVHDYKLFDFALLRGKPKKSLKTVHIVPTPKAKLLKQRCKNDIVREIIIPKVVKKTDISVVYDVGKNISGFVTFTPKSSLVRVRHSEEMKDGQLDFGSAGGSKQISENVYKNAQGRRVHPWFSWSGFRYFEVFGEVDEVEAMFVCSDVAVTADFKCGSENINWLFDTYLHTQLCNMHSGVPSDCPHRERLGYTGDGQLTAESAMLLMDSSSFYEKWIRDIVDCQDPESGHVQHTAPFFGGGGGPGGWGCAIVVVPYSYYKIYGDRKVLKKYYPNMLNYLRCMKGFCEKGLVVRERDKGWCLGDWCAPSKVMIPEPFVNTFYYIRSMEIVKAISMLIGEHVDFSEEIELAKAAITEAYFDQSTGNYCGGVQGANAFALLLGLGDKRTKNNLLSHYRNAGVFDTGIFGTDVLAEYLVKNGEIQLLYDLLNSKEYPSFGYMRACGATTLWEHWSGQSSHNHPMFGGCVKQLFYGLLGISADAGFKRVIVSPKFIEGIEFINAKLKIPGGTVYFDYKYCDGVVYHNITTEGCKNIDLTVVDNEP